MTEPKPHCPGRVPVRDGSGEGKKGCHDRSWTFPSVANGAECRQEESVVGVKIGKLSGQARLLAFAASRMSIGVILPRQASKYRPQLARGEVRAQIRAQAD